MFLVSISLGLRMARLFLPEEVKKKRTRREEDPGNTSVVK